MATAPGKKKSKKSSVNNSAKIKESSIKQAKNKKNNKTVWIIVSVIAGFALLSLIGFIVLIYTVFSGASKDITNSSNAVVSAVIANDPEEIFALSGSTFKNATNKQDIVTTLDRISPIFDGATYKVKQVKTTKSSTSNQLATVNYAISTPDKEAYYMLVTLEKEDGNWYMVNFQTSQNPIDSSTAE